VGKVVIQILQGTVVTQTTLDKLLTIYPPVAYFSQCICVKLVASRQRYCNDNQQLTF